jgi:glutamate-1-semialdehyde 2,1-aminomutase
MLARASQSLAGGVSSPFRAKAPMPLYFRDGCGSRLEDVDGNWYIDYTLAWGPNILGYRHPRVVEAVRRAAEGPHTYGAQHETEYLVSEIVQSLVPCAERTIFCSSGSEACQIAWRLARAFTGRDLILRFEGHYHGWMDSVLLSYRPTSEQLERAEGRPVLGSRGQVANAAENVVAARWNSVEEVQRAFREHPGRIAAVVMEPVLCNSGCIMPCDGYLDAVQRIAKQHGALLMFDEVITGFRIAKGGAQEYYGITPDLATFGKAIGGGLTLSAIAGRREIMELMFTGGVAFGGSFNGNPLALAGAHATLTELSTTDALARAHAAGSALMEGLRAMGLFVTGFPAAFAVHFTPRAELREYRDILDDDSSRLREFILALLAEGVNILPDGRFYVSTVHTAQDVEDTLAAVRRALSR